MRNIKGSKEINKIISGEKNDIGSISIIVRHDGSCQMQSTFDPEITFRLMINAIRRNFEDIDNESKNCD